jgi:cadmium resistance protein CadD (predicted permease)
MMFGPGWTPKPPPGYYYRHEAYFFYMIDLVVLMVALSFANPAAFVAALVLGTMLGPVPMIVIAWSLWKQWYERREHERHNNDDGPTIHDDDIVL